MVKISRKSQENHEAQFPKFSAFIGQNLYFVVIAFKMVKMEFKFNYTKVIMKV